ncbi:MAG: hypothetical protein IKP76_00400 [Bacilli bacterium]|nr:hypothetical protein [Bacilli bacterium]
MAKKKEEAITEEVKEETQEKSVEQEQPKKKSNIGLIVIIVAVAIIGLILLIAIIAIVIIFLLVKPSTKTNEGDRLSTTTTEEVITTETTTTQVLNGKKLYNCTVDNGNVYYSETNKYCSNVKGTITCASKDKCEVVGSDTEEAVINDGGLLKIYDGNGNLKKKLTKFNYINGMEVIDFYRSKSKDRIILIYNNNGYVACINVDKDIYNDGIGIIDKDSDEFYDSYLFLRATNFVPVKNGLYDVTTNKVNTRFESRTYNAVTIDNKDYIIGYTDKKDTIYDYEGDIRLQKPSIWGSNENNAFYFYENKTVTKMDGNFKDVKSINDVDELLLVDKGYTVIVKGTKLILTDQDLNEYITFMDNYNNNDYYVHTAISGWWDKDNNGKEGIYIVVEIKDAELIKIFKKENPKINGDDEDGLGYEYYYYPSTKESGKIASGIGGYAKPVLYLYPTEETNVKVTFDKPSNLTTTYPKYNNSWNVLAKPNGDLYDKNGKYYYALYWEELKNHEISFDEGFYCEGKDAIKFLENKLSYIGLNDRERNEFIMYWLPILEKNEKNLIYFELTEERDKYSPINIEPKPDSLLRIAMHVKKVNKKVNIKEQKLTSFNRTGFTAVEWGGVIH